MKKKKIIVLVTGLIIIAALLVGIFLIPAKENGESINGTMRDEVLHETNKINLFGLEVNPGLISAFTVTGVIFVFSLIVRDRKSTRLNSSHANESRMPSSA